MWQAGGSESPEHELATIGEVARAFGVSLRALRFYEDRGLMASIRRGPLRLYRQQDRARLQLILAAKRLGFTLNEVYELLRKGDFTLDPATQLPAFERVMQPAQIAAQIDHLQRQRDDLDSAIARLREAHTRMAGDPRSNAA